MRRWVIVLCLLAPVTLSGCFLTEWLRREEKVERIDPGPDGQIGTEDDELVIVEKPSKAEEAVEDLPELAARFGFGWIGLALQGLVTVASGAATAMSKQE